MWDVKALEEVSLCPLPVPFYLNYVGCKVSAGQVAWNNTNAFYLNYVGCKVRDCDILETSSCRFI